MDRLDVGWADDGGEEGLPGERSDLIIISSRFRHVMFSGSRAPSSTALSKRSNELDHSTSVYSVSSTHGGVISVIKSIEHWFVA